MHLDDSIKISYFLDNAMNTTSVIADYPCNIKALIVNHIADKSNQEVEGLLSNIQYR